MAHPEPFARPLEDAWRPVLEAVLRRLGAPGLDDVGRLAPRLAELSRAYNEGRAGDAPDRGPTPLEARVAFSFARDVPKGGAAVAELVAAGVLKVPEDRPLRILDLGAGLGAMTWGVVRALAAAGAKGSIEALLVDSDESALAAATRIHAEARESEALGLGALSIGIRTRTTRLGEGEAFAPADLVILGQVLSELDTTLEPAARGARHASLVASLLRSAAPNGTVVVVEPALRARTRHLHAVRDALLASEGAPVVFAPCLHARPCPALASEGDWCHEDRPVDLPAWLVPLARAAGLRFQGLTFSYLVLRREGETLAARVAAEEVRGTRESRLHLRVVSDTMPSKGKVELFGCTERGDRVRLRRLDRDAGEASAAWDELRRGDVVSLSGPPGATSIDERGRLARDTFVDVHRTRS